MPNFSPDIIVMADNASTKNYISFYAKLHAQQWTILNELGHDLPQGRDVQNGMSTSSTPKSILLSLTFSVILPHEYS